MKFTTILYTTIAAATVTATGTQIGPQGSLTVESEEDFVDGANVVFRPPDDEDEVTVATATKLKIYYGDFQLLGDRLFYLFGGKKEGTTNVDAGLTKVDGDIPVLATNPKNTDQQRGFQIKDGYLFGPCNQDTFYACKTEEKGTVIAFWENVTKDDNHNCFRAKLKWNSKDN